jgi:4-amino-4-deoxy-L-arabinose transferase-like glycosyltransferase
MLLTGDYITPRLHGVPWFEKPVLMYWLAAAGYKIFGINEAGVRFPSALGATICVFLVYWCGRKLWDRSTGFIAALILATSIGCFTFARAASMDMLLATCLTMALVFFLVASNGSTPRSHRWFYAFYAALGLGVLAKGPIALVLPVLSLAGFVLLRGTWSEWKTWHPKGLCITAAVAAPWFILCAIVNGWAFLDIFFLTHNFERFTTPIFGHDRPVYFFLPVLLLLTFPWTFLLISALRRTFGKKDHVLLWWAIIPFVFFSFSRSKLPGYILPMVAPIALLLAREIMQSKSRVYRVAVFIEAGTMAFIGVWIFRYDPECRSARERHADHGSDFHYGGHAGCDCAMAESGISCGLQCDCNDRSRHHDDDDGFSSLRCNRHHAPLESGTRFDSTCRPDCVDVQARAMGGIWFAILLV